MQISYSLANISHDIHEFWQYVHQYRILAFSGEMGAGKTTFISALCKYLEISDPVSSPTFALINEYHFDGSVVYHMDWYRLRDANEAVHAGMEDCLLQCVKNRNYYAFIEWPEKALEIIPKPHIWIDISVVNENERTMELSIIQ